MRFKIGDSVICAQDAERGNIGVVYTVVNIEIQQLACNQLLYFDTKGSFPYYADNYILLEDGIKLVKAVRHKKRADLKKSAKRLLHITLKNETYLDYLDTL